MNLHQFAPKMGPQWGVETRKLQSSLARLLQIMSNPEGEFRPLGRFRPSRWASSLYHRRETLGDVKPSAERQAPNRIAQLRLFREYRAWRVPASSLDRHASGANPGV